MGGARSSAPALTGGETVPCESWHRYRGKDGLQTIDKVARRSYWQRESCAEVGQKAVSERSVEHVRPTLDPQTAVQEETRNWKVLWATSANTSWRVDGFEGKGSRFIKRTQMQKYTG